MGYDVSVTSTRPPIVYRWDLDKTYLRTDFDSVRELLRTAFEPPEAKRTVPGARILMRELERTGPQQVCILSGSPEQMRGRIEKKLRLDGVRWDSLTLKPSLQNLMRGRLRFVKDQVLYKLGALLRSRVSQDPISDEVLFGDDAEADAFVYSLYSDICAGLIDAERLMAVLHEARVYEEEIPSLVRLASRVPRRECVRRIFIHLERLREPGGFGVLGLRVCPFYNYFQPALVLLCEGRLSAEATLRVGRALVEEHGFTPDALAASFFDLVTRGHVGGEAARALLAADTQASPATDALFLALREGGAADLEAIGPLVAGPIDYQTLFSRETARAHEAKARARWRRE